MQFFKLITILFLSTLPIKVLAQNDDTWSLTRCQQIQKQIDYYTDLRKRGGSAQEMEHWKQQREKYKDDFDQGNCKKWGKQLNT
jgi:hypothetical protein